MADAKRKRLLRELKDVASDNASGIVIEPLNDNLTELKGAFNGPEGSVYEGGRFEVLITIPDSYPFQPLKMRFITKIYHCNVSSASGAICLDILTSKSWSPVLTLKTTMMSLQSLLTTPEPNDPQDAEVAKVYMNDRAEFERTARFWTEVYAGASSDAKGQSRRKKEDPDADARRADLDPRHVAQFTGMGFERQAVIASLSALGYRGSRAAQISDDAVVEHLLS